jgi:hypothetical protein
VVLIRVIRDHLNQRRDLFQNRDPGVNRRKELDHHREGERAADRHQEDEVAHVLHENGDLGADRTVHGIVTDRHQDVVMAELDLLLDDIRRDILRG